MRILWGLIAVFFGSLIVMKTEWLLNNLGRLEFFETKLGSMGGSRFGYKLIGIALAFLGIALVTNLVEGMGEWIAGFFLPAELRKNI